MQFWALIVDSFRESLDRKIFWVITGLSILVAAAMACVSFSEDGVSLLFGYKTLETSEYNPYTQQGQAMIIDIVVGIMSLFLGWIGVLLMVIATASFFPTVMERGAIDVVLAKPISRWRLFLYKYLASMVFVFLQATLFVALTFLVVGVRWQVWLPGYLLSIPLLVLLFSYIYCVSVLVGVVTRSVVAAILLTIGAWFAFSVPSMALDGLHAFDMENTAAYKVLNAVKHIPPKTGDIEYLAQRYARAGNTAEFPTETLLTPDMTPEERAMFTRAQARERERRDVSLFYSVGSSLLFETAVVLLAMFRFVRRDF